MAHEVGELGFPVDPQLYRLEDHLSKLAGMWRGAKDANNPVVARNLVKEYWATLRLMYDLGWEDSLDLESALPDRLMPEEYLHRLRERLESHLGSLAEKWREAQRANNQVEADDLLRQYQGTFRDLNNTPGWDRMLDPESILPDEFMPKEYLDHR